MDNIVFQNIIIASNTAYDTVASAADARFNWMFCQARRPPTNDVGGEFITGQLVHAHTSKSVLPGKQRKGVGDVRVFVCMSNECGCYRRGARLRQLLGARRILHTRL